MPDPEQAVLRVHGWGGITIGHAHDLLGALEHSYDSIYCYEVFVNHLAGDDDSPFYPRYMLRDWWDPDVPPHEVVPAGSHMVLRSVSLQSPGFLGIPWEHQIR